MIETAPAIVKDIVYVDHLQKKNAEDLAFFPKTVLEREIGNARIILARFNGEPCGYLYHGALRGVDLKIHQACIEYDLRGRLYGAQLVRDIVALANAAGMSSISCRCGSDILANGFWQAVGFECIGISKGGARRMRDINHWRMELSPDLVGFDIIEPSTKKKSATAWAKARKQGKSSNRFRRNSSMLNYRKQVEEQDNQDG